MIDSVCRLRVEMIILGKMAPRAAELVRTQHEKATAFQRCNPKWRILFRADLALVAVSRDSSGESGV